MARDDIDKEIAELRARVEQLAQERRARESGEPPTVDPDSVPTGDPDTPEGTNPEDVENTEEVSDAETEGPTIVDHIRDLIKNLDEELQETKPLTLLGVFALGLLVGRLTAK